MNVCTLYVSVRIRSEETGGWEGDEAMQWGLEGNSRLLLGVAFVERAGSSLSGEVEWLVPAYHVATAVVATLPIAVFTVPVVARSHSGAWTRARGSWRLGTPNALLIL